MRNTIRLMLPLAAALAVAGPAYAVEPQLRVAAGACHGLTPQQSSEFGWGATGAIGAGLRVSRSWAVLGGLESMIVSTSSPAPTGYERNATGNALMASVGLRVLPLAVVAREERLWLSTSAGWVHTGDLSRLGLSADLGYDVLRGRIAVGPFLGYRQIVQPDSELRINDARLATMGLQGAWGAGEPARAVPVDGDQDHDGIADSKDACPHVAEDRDGFQDSDGCPDPDNDGDGIVDKSDRCPLTPEDKDGFEDEDGCPESDNDRDGIPDATDGCPREPEDKDGFEDKDGCPDPDNDKDGIADVRDKCPDVPEDFNQYEDEDGCPDDGGVQVIGTRITLRDKIFFEWDRAAVRKQSLPVIERMAAFLSAHPEFLEISIEGHTDEHGNPRYNQLLSEARARAVREVLIGSGVAANRLVSRGFGESKPIVSGHSEAASQVNRRVEFIVTRRLPGPAPAEHGSDKP